MFSVVGESLSRYEPFYYSVSLEYPKIRLSKPPIPPERLLLNPSFSCVTKIRVTIRDLTVKNHLNSKFSLTLSLGTHSLTRSTIEPQRQKWVISVNPRISVEVLWVASRCLTYSACATLKYNMFKFRTEAYKTYRKRLYLLEYVWVFIFAQCLRNIWRSISQIVV